MLMPQLQPGDVVVTSGSRNWQSRVIMWFSNSPWTHVFLVGEKDRLYESYYPVGVVRGNIVERFQELAEDGQTYRVLRNPSLTRLERLAVVDAANALVGRKYDVVQAVVFGLFHVFIADGPLRLTCSRFITAAFTAADLDCFPTATLDVRFGQASRRYQELRNGWCTPGDLLEFSALTEQVALDPRTI